MKKKIMVLYIGFLLLLCACAGENTAKSEQKIKDKSAFQFKAADNTASALKEVDLSVITADPNNEIFAITSTSIVYSYTGGAENGIRPCTFYKYDVEAGETAEIGTIYNWSYGMGETLVNNKLYIPRVCQLSPNEESSSWIIELDLEEKKMSVVSEAKNHVSFYSRNMQGFGKHLILQQTEEQFQRLIAYDTETKEMISLIKYEHDSETNTGKWISAFDVGMDSISVLVKTVDTAGEEHYHIEVYDRKINLVDTIDVTGIANWSHGIFDFEYENGYLIYSTINHSGGIGRIDGDNFESLALYKDLEFYLMSESAECMQYKMWLDQESKELYRFDMKRGTLEKAVLYSGFSEDLFVSAKRYSENVIVLHERPLNQNSTEEYRYILVDELDFAMAE